MIALTKPSASVVCLALRQLTEFFTWYGLGEGFWFQGLGVEALRGSRGDLHFNYMSVKGVQQKRCSVWA